MHMLARSVAKTSHPKSTLVAASRTRRPLELAVGGTSSAIAPTKSEHTIDPGDCARFSKRCLGSVTAVERLDPNQSRIAIPATHIAP